MKNRLIITISDVHGSKQYSVHDMIKKVIFFAIPTFILIGVLTLMYIRFLNTQVDAFESQMLVLKESSQKLKKQNESLGQDNLKLAEKMQESSDKLSSINAQLHEVEELIGIGPDINGTFTNLSEQVRTHEEKIKQQQSADINSSIHHATKALKQTAKKEKLSAIQKALLLNSIPNGKPLNYRRVSSKFGYRIHPVTKQKSFHAGLDLPARHGTPIYAPASGVVVYAKEKGAYGNFLLITHSYGFKTAYGHLSRYAVKSGDYVIKGQKIAYVGSTGRSTGPHLHYEIRYLSKWVDPKVFMAWDLDNINYITDKIKTVNWKSILKQTKKLISLSTK